MSPVEGVTPLNTGDAAVKRATLAALRLHSRTQCHVELQWLALTSGPNRKFTSD